MGNVIIDASTKNEITERANYFIKERVEKIPANYKREKDHIVHEMHKASPNAFHDLYMADYPEKNEKQVNKLAINNVTSKEVKKQIVREINAEVDPIVDEKTADSNKVVRTATKNAIRLAIKKAVGAAVKAVQVQLERQFVVNSNENEKTS